MRYPNAPFGAPPPPPRKNSTTKIVLIVLGVVVVAIMVLGGVIGVLAGGSVTGSDDVAVGDCIILKGSNDQAEAEKASCGSDDFTFLVAEKYDLVALPCLGANYSQITWKDKGRLCLTPNFRVGQCYRFPVAENGPLSGIGASECTSSADATSVVIKVVKRASSLTEADCASGRVFTFPKPEPVAYCLTRTSG